MIRSAYLSTFAVVGGFLLSGTALASEPAASEQTTPSTQGETPTTPATPATPAPTTQNAERDPLDEIVCRKEEATVGSRLGSRKVCKTRRQWRDEKRDSNSPDIPDGSLQSGPRGTTS